MAAPVVSPRKSIREVVMQTVLAHHSQQLLTRKRKRLSSGASAQGVGDDDDIGFWEEEEGTMEMTQIGAERTKNVLILMSDTGGGHRASAEAIRDAFRIEFGDEYKVGLSLVLVPPFLCLVQVFAQDLTFSLLRICGKVWLLG